MDARSAEILSALRTPKTYEELSEEFGVGYYTIRKHVQILVDLGFVKELPWPKQGTKQKQFVSNAYNPEHEFTPEGCSIFSLPNGRAYTAAAIVGLPVEAMHHYVELPILALSAPLWEYMAQVNPSEFFTSTRVSSDKVVKHLTDAREKVEALLDFINQLIAVGTWDPRSPENNKILFHKEPEKVNWEEVRNAYKRLQNLAEERNW